MTWERVHTINDFWDKPTLGVADVFGRPHCFECVFNETEDEFGDSYRVSPMEPDLLALVLEDRSIWVRWDAAFKRGETTMATHPALPADRPRHEELERLIGTRLKPDPESGRVLKARFRSVHTGWDGMEVEWSEPDR